MSGHFFIPFDRSESKIVITTAYLVHLLLNLYYQFVNLRLYLYLYLYLYLTMSPAGAASAHLSGPLNHTNL